MCFNISISQFLESLEKRFSAKFAEPELFKPVYHASAFRTPRLPVITNEDSKQIQFLRWGLVPFWIKNEAAADQIRYKTFNAKAETIFEKPSFRSSIQSKRCLVIVDGFFEWQHLDKKRFPYYIHMSDKSVFALAGIWDLWEDKQSGSTQKTFSIITTEANPLLAEIHNTKKRMPVILKKNDERIWLQDDLTKDDIDAILVPYENTDIEAHTVSKLISTRGKNTNVKEALEKYEYDELKEKQSKLF